MTPRLFISYSHKDKDHCEELVSYLSVLVRRGWVEIWWDPDIPPGDPWNEKIMAELNSADIIVLLISNHFLNSTFCMDHEAKRALERQRAEEARVIPALLSPSLFDQTELSSLQALPSGARPVTNWDNEAQAFDDIARGILRIVQEPKPQQPPVSKERVIEVEPRVSCVPLFGREGDLQRALSLLPKQSFAITGIKGIGKSKLASALFEHATTDTSFPFRSYYWRSFIGDHPPSFSAFARRLVKDLTDADMPAEGIGPGEQLQWVKQALAGEKCLLVIDQFEGVIDGKTRRPSEGYEQLLNQAWGGDLGDARLVVTAWHVPTMKKELLPFNYVPLGGIDNAAARKFIKGEMNVPGPTPGRPLDALIQQVGGHPLALMLIARNYASIQQAADMPGSRLLQGTVEDIAAKIVSEAYDYVSDAATIKVLSSVCIFSGPCDLPAVSYVAQTNLEETHRLLTDLAERALVSSLPEWAYSAHALVREHVLKKLAPGEKVDLHRKAAKSFLEMPRKKREDRKSITDLQPLVSAVYHLMSGGEFEEAGELFVEEDLHRELYRWGHFLELVDLYECFLREALPKGMASLFLGDLGLIHRDLGDLMKGIGRNEKALELAKECGDRRLECAALVNLGDLHYYWYERSKSLLDELDKAFEYHLQAQELLETIVCPDLEQKNYGCLGNVYRAKQDLPKAKDCFEKAKRISAEIGDRRCEGIWAGGLGNVYWSEKEYSKAIECYEEAIRIADEIDDRRHRSWWRGVLADLYYELGDTQKALDLLETALSISEAIHYRRGIQQQSQSLGMINASIGEYCKAVEFYKRSMAVSLEMNDKESAERHRGAIHGILSQNMEHVINKNEIDQVLQEIESTFETPLDRARFFADIGGACRNLGGAHFDKGIENYTRAITIMPDSSFYRGRANCFADSGKLEQAISDYSEAIVLDPQDVISMLSKMEIEIRAGRHADALSTYNSVPVYSLSSAYSVVAAYLICIALCLEGLPYEDYIGPVKDKTVDVREAAWEFGDVGEYLLGLRSSDIPQELVGGALMIHDILKAPSPR
jgi:tetratricopeptide (TPR) repeat protein